MQRHPQPESSTTNPIPEGRNAGEKKTVTIKGIDYTFCWCPAGTFTMGSSESEKEHQSQEAQHEVTFTHGFWILKHEVTQEMWESVMVKNPSYFKGKRLPVESVSWYDCQDYISKLNDLTSGKFRLPTEAQREYACRAGTTGKYNESGNLDEMGWYIQNSKKRTHEIKTKTPNEWGIYDMHGNVSEWCQDWYGDYPNESITDPVGPDNGSSRVFRGGGWSTDAKHCQSTTRFFYSPNSRYIPLGFRLAQSSDH